MRKRLIPVLLIDRESRLVKTVRFGNRTYVGDPFNVVRLFNEYEVDEICVLDIDATRENRGPNFAFLEQLASECFMPLSYGGGIKSLDDALTLNRFGVEKLVLNAHAHDIGMVRRLVDTIGSQALVACINYHGAGPSARADEGLHPLEVAHNHERSGFGELLLQSVDRDGMRIGYDLETLRAVSASVAVPVIALGGAGERKHLRPALDVGASAVASGSAFTFIGRLRAVLINYPRGDEIDRITGGY